jgi:DNA polymerase IV (archaeal DinB-like DNA polymerase)
VIGHLDLDYFYAQVEEVADPALKGRPVVVCVFSGRTEDSGVVSTANYVARDFGVRSSMPISLAKKKLEGKNPVLIKMEREKYENVSERIMELVRTEVDVIEQTGIDEAFFDITRKTSEDYSMAKSLGVALKTDILRTERLTCSVGIGKSKVVAKIASDYKKPDGLTVVTPESTIRFLRPLPVTKMYGVGPKAARTLEAAGIKTLGDLASSPVEVLGSHFGRKMGIYLHRAATGDDEEPVEERETTQFSRIVTLKNDTLVPELAFAELLPAIDDLHSKLVAKGSSFRVVSVIGVLTDLSIKTRSYTFERPINDLGLLREESRRLLVELAGSVPREFRRVGVRVSGLAEMGSQTSITAYYQEERVDLR